MAILVCGTVSFQAQAACKPSVDAPPPAAAAVESKTAAAAPVAAQAASIEGRWCTGKDDAVIEVSVSGGTLSGKLVATSEKRAKLGTTILRDFKKEGTVWKGTLYAPRRSKNLPAELTQQGDALHITVQSPLGEKSVEWTRGGC